uniref:Uncharacterized protein n=1 Tax=Oryza rufipogon TaxID=4529 RepID=A0A0E0NXH8_ORYRU
MATSTALTLVVTIATEKEELGVYLDNNLISCTPMMNWGCHSKEGLSDWCYRQERSSLSMIAACPRRSRVIALDKGSPPRAKERTTISSRKEREGVEGDLDKKRKKKEGCGL